MYWGEVYLRFSGRNSYSHLRAVVRWQMNRCNTCAELLSQIQENRAQRDRLLRMEPVDPLARDAILQRLQTTYRELLTALRVHDATHTRHLSDET